MGNSAIEEANKRAAEREVSAAPIGTVVKTSFDSVASVSRTFLFLVAIFHFNSIQSISLAPPAFLRFIYCDALNNFVFRESVAEASFPRDEKVIHSNEIFLFTISEGAVSSGDHFTFS